MKFKIEEFCEKFMPALALCFGIILILEPRDILSIIIGIFFIVTSILIFIMTSSDFGVKHKSILEKAEEKAIKYKKKLERKKVKKCKKEYKSLKKEIFKCITKGESRIRYSFSRVQPISALLIKLNYDKDFKGLYFTAYETIILWERDKDSNVD